MTLFERLVNLFMAKLSKDEILKAVEEMSVLELSDLVKALEEKFGVTAAAPVAAAAAAPAGEPKEEQTVFNVVLTAAGAQKIQVIKAVRELVPTLGLTDAKALVESAQKEVLSGVNKTTAEEAKKKLETAGAKVELK
jgi:large subunit ribosomal protein L7/L12